MSYTIFPAEMATVFTRTGAERDTLQRSLVLVTALAGVAGVAAASAAPVGAALGAFQTAQADLTRDVLDRVAAALHHGDRAVDAYVHGDLVMAEQQGRAAAVVSGPRFAPPDLSGPRPAQVQGG